jgi:hypothetical protein
VFGFRPGLMQLRDQLRIVEQLPKRVPDARIEPLRPHELGVAPGGPAHAQRRVAFARVIEVFVLFADAQLADAHHTQAALAAFHERAEQIPA